MNTKAEGAMERIIRAAVERGASDLHIKAGDVFRARIDGKLVPLTKQRLTPDQTRAIALKLLTTDEDRARLETLRDYDCSWGMPGVGRFRVNILRQRSSIMIVMRVIPFAVPTLASLNLPRTAGQAGGVGAGPADRVGNQRGREVVHHGGAGAPHQPDAAEARRDGREPDRVPASGPHLLGDAAGGRCRHRHLCLGPSRGAAAGSRRGRHRRAGRRRHGVDGDQGGGERFPRHHLHADARRGDYGRTGGVDAAEG